MRRNIAFIHAGFPGGGAERITTDIATYLNKFKGKYKVFVITCYLAQSRLTSEHLDNITFIHMKSTSIKFLSEVVRKYNIHIIVQSSYAIKNIQKVKKDTGVKILYACHEEPFWRRYLTKQRGVFRKITYSFLPNKYKNQYTYRLAVNWTKKAYQNCDAMTVLCNEYVEIIKQGLKLDHNHHIYAIENPEYKRETVNYKKDKIILYSGRLDQMSKTLDKLLRIWQRVQTTLTEWELVISGDGPDKEFLLKEATRLELVRCNFIGLQANMQPWYDKASIVCLTSRTEGWPLCLTEAQASGCIPIAFGCTAGIIDILSPDDEGICGFTITPFDENAYADTLISIATMPEEEQHLIRQNAVKKRAKYIPEKISEKWRLLFEKISIDI